MTSMKSWIQSSISPTKVLSQPQFAYEQLELSDRPAPRHDEGVGTKKVCIAALISSVLVGIAFIALGIYARGSAKVYEFRPVTRELLPLGLNFLVLLVTESTGYLHATSLRWALFYENRLEYNTNLRLMTTSQKSFPNGAICNLIYLICTAVCYAASPMILVQNTHAYYATDGGVAFNTVARLNSLSRTIPVCLGVAILILCSLSAWCLRASRIPTWSSDPLNTLAVAMKEGLNRREGRCMMSVHDRNMESRPTRPRYRQKSARMSHKNVIRALFGVSVTLGALFVWMGLVVPYGIRNSNGKSWSFVPTQTINSGSYFDSKNQTMTIFLQFFVTEPVFNSETGALEPDVIGEPTMAGVLFFCLSIQTFITVGLHCIELQVNLARDENVWRTLAA